MAKRHMPSPDDLRNVLEYNPDTGVLTWKTRGEDTFLPGVRSVTTVALMWNVKYSGKTALTCIGNHGYRHGHVMRRQVLAHRVIWAMMTGEWPTGEIDHMDGDRINNRWSNLRHVDKFMNQRNRKRSSRNTSGHCGVRWNVPNRKWSAEISVNKRTKFLGYFSAIEDAIVARKQAERGLGFTDRHGSPG